MDRRTWLQLIAILTAARDANAQQGAGRGPDQPMRVTKEQVVGALQLMGLEFQDGEIDMMLRGANTALSNYEGLRKADIPLDTEPAFAFHPGLPDRQPGKGPQRFETTIGKTPAMKAPATPAVPILSLWIQSITDG